MNDYKQKKQKICTWHKNLRNDICKKLESIEKNKKFKRKKWQRKGGGGGEMAMLHGKVFEKAAVHISTVFGTFEKGFRKQIRGAQTNGKFWASGISVIIHPKNPHVPTIHFNTRMIITTQLWFGGGSDLTPMLPTTRKASHSDTIFFHKAWQNICQQHKQINYKKIKKQCDEYFYLPHRKEPRGIGGIFFDNLNSKLGWQKDFAFIQDVGKTFLDIYPQLVAKNRTKKFNEKQRQQQLAQRSRYVEFNLLYDKGTLFGLKTNGNVEAILSSMPPIVYWN